MLKHRNRRRNQRRFRVWIHRRSQRLFQRRYQLLIRQRYQLLIRRRNQRSARRRSLRLIRQANHRVVHQHSLPGGQQATQRVSRALVLVASLPGGQQHILQASPQSIQVDSRRTDHPLYLRDSRLLDPVDSPLEGLRANPHQDPVRNQRADPAVNPVGSPPVIQVANRLLGQVRSLRHSLPPIRADSLQAGRPCSRHRDRHHSLPGNPPVYQHRSQAVGRARSLRHTHQASRHRHQVHSLLSESFVCV
jgi:hypothetical protein